jgi:hypothetical protein
METGMTTQKFLVAMMALMIATASASAQSAQAPPSPTGPVTIVLVHGALIDGSSWRGVFDVLTRDGYDVSVAQPPLTGLEEPPRIRLASPCRGSRNRDSGARRQIGCLDSVAVCPA